MLWMIALMNYSYRVYGIIDRIAATVASGCTARPGVMQTTPRGSADRVENVSPDNLTDRKAERYGASRPVRRPATKTAGRQWMNRISPKFGKTPTAVGRQLNGAGK